MNNITCWPEKIAGHGAWVITGMALLSVLMVLPQKKQSCLLG